MTPDEKTKLAQELAQVLAQLKRVGWQSNTNQDIRQSEIRLLFTLLETGDGGVKASDVSTHMQITPAAVTHMLNSLDEGGYIERQIDSSDRRVVLVRLTEKGKQTIESLRSQFLEKLTGLIEFLGEQDSRELVRLLAEMLIYFKGRLNAETLHA